MRPVATRLAATIAGLLVTTWALVGCAPSLPTAENGDVSVAAVDSFATCLAAGFPVMESYPRQCRTSDGRTFTENIGNEFVLMDLIRVDSPRPGTEVTSPLHVAGQARGSWFFEASFLVEIVDASGTVVASGAATAQDEWMTEAFVPFEATLEFAAPAGEAGELVLRRANPSGLPEFEGALRVPIVFP